LKLLIPLIALISLNSCSWFRDLERSLVDDNGKAPRGKSRTVPRAQYDQLLVKYEELSKKYEQLKETPPTSQGSLADELQKTQSENFATPSSNADAETVNVFPDSAAAVAAASASPSSVSGDIEGQLGLYRKGLSLKNTNPGEATKIFQQLENQGIPSVKVRAKYQIGEILLSSGQYDLSLQVFEEIINKHADSGVVLDALTSAISASDKLGVTAKKDQYSSMLNDVFGSQGR
jgi:hypothetical protein